MGDLFGKDMDNLGKFLGGSGGSKRRNKQKDDKHKADFTYVQEKSVFVCINGKPKAEGSVIRCAVHDLETVEELKERVSDLLFFNKETCRCLWMEDGVELRCLTVLHERDILFASTVQESFYGDVLKPEKKVQEEKPAPVDVESEKVKETPQILPKEGKDANQSSRSRPFFQPGIISASCTSEVSDVNATGDKMSESLVGRYGGAEYFSIPELLRSDPNATPTIPKHFLMGPELNPNVTQTFTVEQSSDAPPSKRLYGLSGTEYALKELLKNSEQKISTVLETLRASTERPVGEAKAVGDIGVLKNPELEQTATDSESARKEMSKKQIAKLQEQQMKKNFKKQQKRKEKKTTNETRNSGE